MGFKFEFTSKDTNYVNNLGRVINRDKTTAINAGYIIKVYDSEGNTLEKEFQTVIPPEIVFV